MTGLKVRISLAAPEADLAAAVWPGLSAVCCPSAESAAQIEAIDRLIGRLERLRGIRPGTIAIQPFVETAPGVANAYAVASGSGRIRAFGPGPKLYLHLDVQATPETGALLYARSECELVARALDLEPATTDYMAD